MDLEKVEIELRKRLNYPYHWGRQQSDAFDSETNFIYSTQNFDILLQKTSKMPQDLRDYALNRWYNFWSAMTVEHIFTSHKNVFPNKNSRDKLIDFSIDGLAFDHKTSRFPKAYTSSLAYAIENKKELIEWFYEHQSQQGRRHLANRLFVVLYDTHEGLHWKMKSELGLIKEQVDNYVQHFEQQNLVHLDFGKGIVYSDIIWVLY